VKTLIDRFHKNLFTTFAMLCCLAIVESSASARSVVAWANPYFTSDAEPTNVPPGLTNVVAITGGPLVLKDDGTVVAWGVSGDATNVLAALNHVVAISGGAWQGVALESDGTLVVWGDSDYVGTPPPGLSNVIAVATGNMHSIALKADGSLIVWGGIFDGDLGATNVPPGLTNIVGLGIGFGHQCLVLRSDGTEYGWGDNNAGSVLDVESSNPIYAAGAVILDGQPLSNIVALAAGNHQSVALKNDGTVVGWPRADTENFGFPKDLSNLVAIASSGLNSDLFLQSDGTMVAWSLFGQTAPSLTNVVAVAGGTDYGLALIDDTAPFDGSPFFVQHPFSETAPVGATRLFVVNAIGQVPLHYQWQFKGTNIDGANASTLLLTNLSLADAGSYQCVVSNAVATVVSSPASLTIQRPVLQFDVSSLTSTNGFSLQLTGLSGHGDVVLYSSADLVNWTPIFTNPPVTGSLQLLDASATNASRRFYRAEER
jgi:hypothetical protein